MGVMVDVRHQQIALAHDSIAIRLVIFVDVVAFLCCLIEGIVGVAFPDLLEKGSVQNISQSENDAID